MYTHTCSTRVSDVAVLFEYFKMVNTNQKIFFKKESDSFYKELKEEIENYFVEKNINKYANNFMFSMYFI